MKYDSEPKVRRISEVKSKEQQDTIKAKGVEKSNNHSRSRKKSSSSHTRSKNAKTLHSSDSGTPVSNAINPSRVTSEIKSDTKRSSKLPNSKNIDENSIKSSSSEDTQKPGKFARYWH